jgi:hypothetical protein
MFPLNPKLQKSCNGNQQNSSSMDGWKTTLTWCYNNSCKLVAQQLFMHNCNWNTQITYEYGSMYGEFQSLQFMQFVQ